MEMIRNRATDLFPSVLLTVLSMIQALALELLWTRMRESPYLWSGGWDALLGWSQVAAMLLGFLVVWLFYVSTVMRFRWLPSLQDSVVPFGIGILEFTLIDLMGPDSLGPWFYVMAATMRDFAPSIAAAGGIGVLGLVLHVSGSPGWLALGSLLITIAALAYQIELTRRYWERSISDAPAG